MLQLLTVIYSRRDGGQIRLPAWSTTTRLIEDNTNAEERGANEVENEEAERPQQHRIWEGS